jgi:MFS family permease
VYGLPVEPRARRLVLALCATTLLLWLGAGAILPLLPLYLRAHGSSPALVGVIMAAFFAASVLTQYPSGRLSDASSARAVVVGGLVLFAGASTGFALFPEPGAAIAFRALEGIGAGAVSVASAAAIGARVTPKERGGAFGALYGSQMLALAVGPLLGSVVGRSSMPGLFLGAAGLSLVAIAPLVAILPTSVSAEGSASRVSRARTPHARTDVVRLGGRVVLGVLVAFGAAGLLTGVYESCWTLLLGRRHASSFEVGLSWTLFALPFAALSIPAGRLAQRRDRRVLSVGALCSSAAFCALYPFLHQVSLLVGLGVVEAAGAVIGAPAAVLVLAETVPPTRQGAAQGALETARTATTAAAAALSGALFGVAPGLPFVLAASLALLACGFIWWAWRGLAHRDAHLRGTRTAWRLFVEQASEAPESLSRRNRAGR